MGGFDQIGSLVFCHGQGFFAQDMKACGEERLGEFVMGRVGRGHRHQINAVGAVTLALQHLAPIAVSAVSRQP